jgi:glucokinase
VYLAIEIGGTKLQLGLGTGDGRIVAIERRRIDPAAGAEAIRHAIVELVPLLRGQPAAAGQSIAGVGIGFGGPVDTETGTIAKSHHVSGWDGFPLAAWCEREWGWRAVVHNDADTAGLAEARFGAAIGMSPVFYVTIGSGVGGGLLLDGQIYRGAGAGAAEIGHLCVAPPGSADTPETCPTVEGTCSGWSIARRARAAIDAPEAHAVEAAADLLARAGDRDRLTADVVAQAAASGNPLALRLLDDTWRVLGWAIAQVVTLLCPRRVVIGGGVSLMGEDLLFRPLRREVARHVFPPFRSCFDIVPAALAESVVVHGALALARDHFEHTH